MKKNKVLLVIIMGFILSYHLSYGTMEPKEIEKYSKEELIILQQIGQKIEKENSGTMAIGVEKIVSPNISFKFDTPPILFENRTLVPIRALAESLGASVTWDPVNQKVLIDKEDKKIILYINETKVTSDDKEKTIDVPAKIFSSRTYVPLRFVIEEYGLEIEYDSKTAMITITEK